MTSIGKPEVARLSLQRKPPPNGVKGEEGDHQVKKGPVRRSRGGWKKGEGVFSRGKGFSHILRGTLQAAIEDPSERGVSSH